MKRVLAGVLALVMLLCCVECPSQNGVSFNHNEMKKYFPKSLEYFEKKLKEVTR